MFLIVSRPATKVAPLIVRRMSALGNGQAMSKTARRSDKRTSRKFSLWLSPGSEPMYAELASTENVSSRGVRVRTEVSWKPDSRVFVKLPQGGVWTRARIAYCQKLGAESHAMGLEFCTTAHRYNITFRCIHCGTHGASANFRSDHEETEAEIQSRIYQVQCAGCGWSGEACGFSAVRILRYKSLEMRSAEASRTAACPPATTKRTELGKVCSKGAA